MNTDIMGEVMREELDFAQCKKILPSLTDHNASLWVCRYTHKSRGWILSIATHAAQQSNFLSLGGFRIAPLSRVEIPDYDNDAEAIGLAVGMEKKVDWTRAVGVAGERGSKNLDRIVGGKCVLFPSPGSRVGESDDFALLEFAVTCLQNFKDEMGILVNTGQDLGHGIMSDGSTHSLVFLNNHFPGSILANTSKPTAEGNFYALQGALQALDLDRQAVRIGLIGCGNIGSHILGKLLEQDYAVEVLEASEVTRARLEKQGLKTHKPEEKATFMSSDFDALVINANGGTLDAETVRIITENPHVKLITGCENLVMPEYENGKRALQTAKKIFCPTEFCGMMGYLTAVEEYVSFLDGVPFSIDSMVEAAKGLEQPSRRAAQMVIERDHAICFSDAVRQLSKTA